MQINTGSDQRGGKGKKKKGKKKEKDPTGGGRGVRIGWGRDKTHKPRNFIAKISIAEIRDSLLDTGGVVIS